MKRLCTFSGRFGDILWSLPTVREVARKHGQAVDMAIMPAYRSLLPLLELQPYIDKAFVIDDWNCVGSPYGDQPWETPRQEGYDEVFHLTYRYHPQGSVCVADFIAAQQGLKLPGSAAIPFITAPIDSLSAKEGTITYAFNPMYAEQKAQFFTALQRLVPAIWVDVSKLSWCDAAAIIDSAGLFVGCRASNWVLAMGLGVQTVTYEPHPNRWRGGPFGKVFSGPLGTWEASTGVEPLQAAQDAAKVIQALLRNREQEVKSA